MSTHIQNCTQVGSNVPQVVQKHYLVMWEYKLLVDIVYCLICHKLLKLVNLPYTEAIASNISVVVLGTPCIWHLFSQEWVWSGFLDSHCTSLDQCHCQLVPRSLRVLLPPRPCSQTTNNLGLVVHTITKQYNQSINISMLLSILIGGCRVEQHQFSVFLLLFAMLLLLSRVYSELWIFLLIFCKQT